MYAESGTYSVLVSDANNCMDSITFNIQENNAICGCIDSTAFNYNSVATFNDGSCIPIIYGCTDTNAANYYIAANIDDGTCMYIIHGCMDSLACNFNSQANINNNSCNYQVEVQNHRLERLFWSQ